MADMTGQSSMDDSPPAADSSTDTGAVDDSESTDNSSQDEPGGKAKKDDCDSVRYSMLSTQASSSEPELDKIHSIPLDQACLASVSLARNLSFLWRSQAPPFSGLGVSPHLSQVVLRI